MTDDKTKLYRVRLKLYSSIVTPLKGDTIWGHIVWGIANNKGDKEVDIFLDQEKSDPPALVVSSAFPAGMLCRNLPLPVERGELDEEEYAKIKKEKKKKYKLASEYFEEAETPNDKMKNIQKDIKEGVSVMHNIPVMHNTIDRSNNTVLDGGGGPYSIEEKWSGILKDDTYTNIDWDLYILSYFDPDRIRELVDWAFENGYGADASTGKGKIERIGDPIQVKPKVKPKKEGNKYMALGPFVGTDKTKKIRADVFVRSGKLGGSFASGLSPYKKPVVLFDEGAVFECDTEIKYAGRLLEKMHEMHGTDELNICQSGFAPVIPIEQED